MICASEQSVTVMESIYSEVRKEFEYRGCYFLKPGEIDKVRKTIIVNGALNAKLWDRRRQPLPSWQEWRYRIEFDRTLRLKKV